MARISYATLIILTTILFTKVYGQPARLAGAVSISASNRRTSTVFTDGNDATCLRLATGEHTITIDLQGIRNTRTVEIMSRIAVTGVEVIFSATSAFTVPLTCGSAYLRPTVTNTVTCSPILTLRYLAIKMTTANEICEVKVFKPIAVGVTPVNQALNRPTSVSSEATIHTTQLTDDDLVTCHTFRHFGVNTHVITTIDLTATTGLESFEVTANNPLQDFNIQLVTTVPPTSISCCTMALRIRPPATCICATTTPVDKVKLDVRLQATPAVVCEVKISPVVDGAWTTWSVVPPSGCTVSCGGGTFSKSRTCSQPAPSPRGLPCPGSGTDAGACNPNPCPTHGGWRTWAHGACPATCGLALEWLMSRSCTNPSPAHGGNICVGPTTMTSPCTPTPPRCPVHGAWTAWAPGACPATCGLRLAWSMSRTCTNPSPAHGGNHCVGPTTMTSPCAPTPPRCPVAGGFSAWIAAGQCGVTCGTGLLPQTRTCTNPPPQFLGAPCVGPQSRNIPCTMGPCPIHGAWATWTHGACSATCGRGLLWSMSRTCTNPIPGYGGNRCVGHDIMTSPCVPTPPRCPIAGGFSAWIAQGPCGVTCGRGLLPQTRSCSNPPPQFGGAPCVGSRTRNIPCTMITCPIHGAWTAWAHGPCPSTCGVGIVRPKTRTCTNPAPQHRGRMCSGSNTAFGPCVPTPPRCPIDGDWSLWTQNQCSVTCGTGSAQYVRSCNDPAPLYGGRDCVGIGNRTGPCIVGRCPVHGSWGTWVLGSCSVTCGTGNHGRTRQCNNPPAQYGGVECRGDSTSTVTCRKRACSVIRRLPKRIIMFIVALMMSFAVTIGLVCILVVSSISRGLGRRSSSLLSLH